MGTIQEWGTRHVNRTLAMFAGHNANIQALLASEVFFGISIGWFTVYRPLYMVALGVTEIQVGFITSLAVLSQILGSLLGGHFADHWGRKRTMQFFDMIGWGSSITLWLFASNYWFFVAAALLNGVFFGAIPSWNCIVVENTPSDRRASVYGLIHLLFLGAGMFGPVGGLLVARYGVITGSRWIFGVGLVLVATALLIRQLFVQEAPKGISPEVVVSSKVNLGFGRVLRLMLKNRQVTLLVLINVAAMFALAVWNTYGSLYMTHQLGLALSPSVISILPTLNSASIIVMLLLVMPHVTEVDYQRYLVYGSVMVALGAAVFVLAPAGVLWPLAVFALLNAGGGAIRGPVHSGYLSTVVADHERAKVLSLMSTLTLLAIIPAGPIAGYLYQQHVASPFYLVCLLQLLNVGLAISLLSSARRALVQKQKPRAIG